jgi:hypothetical protein
MLENTFLENPGSGMTPLKIDPSEIHSVESLILQIKEDQ